MRDPRLIELGRTIRELRKAQPLSLRALAKAANVSPALLCLIENGQHRARREHIACLANLLGASEDDLCLVVDRLSLKTESALVALAKERPVLFDAMRDLALELTLKSE